MCSGSTAAALSPSIVERSCSVQGRGSTGSFIMFIFSVFSLEIHEQNGSYEHVVHVVCSQSLMTSISAKNNHVIVCSHLRRVIDSLLSFRQRRPYFRIELSPCDTDEVLQWLVRWLIPCHDRADQKAAGRKTSRLKRSPPESFEVWGS